MIVLPPPALLRCGPVSRHWRVAVLAALPTLRAVDFRGCETRVTGPDVLAVLERVAAMNGSLGKLEELRLFDASRNSLSGDLPADLLDLPKLREVNLSENAGLGGTVVVPKIPSPLRVLDLRGTKGQLKTLMNVIQRPHSVALIRTPIKMILSRNRH